MLVARDRAKPEEMAEAAKTAGAEVLVIDAGSEACERRP
ncbi:hypothetical protein MPL1032_200041 [Mesorhizobium plurifarium]|uniref:Uncharacterized protein n=1 Tax=Mesorhizobium plurifarium TaxID=69974 RepID=A0A0K2VY56_MESPL|nr:hypothetical protein MPL1032_200041 [Mesorhizobium plurifarium]